MHIGILSFSLHNESVAARIYGMYKNNNNVVLSFALESCGAPDYNAALFVRNKRILMKRTFKSVINATLYFHFCFLWH